MRSDSLAKRLERIEKASVAKVWRLLFDAAVGLFIHGFVGESCALFRLTADLRVPRPSRVSEMTVHDDRLPAVIGFVAGPAADVGISDRRKIAAVALETDVWQRRQLLIDRWPTLPPPAPLVGVPQPGLSFLEITGWWRYALTTLRSEDQAQPWPMTAPRGIEILRRLGETGQLDSYSGGVSKLIAIDYSLSVGRREEAMPELRDVFQNHPYQTYEGVSLTSIAKLLADGALRAESGIGPAEAKAFVRDVQVAIDMKATRGRTFS